MFAHRTILILDDDPLVSDALALGLRDHGYTVETNDNLADAIANIRRVAPDAMLSDVQMPRLADAAQIAILRSIFPSLPILAMSGTINLEALALAKGANLFLPKPARASAIVAALANIMQPSPRETAA